MNDTMRCLSDGAQFGRYLLGRPLGRGGLGDIYQAEDTIDQRTVALKVLPSVFSYDLVFCARLQRLARVVSELREPHIVPIHDYGEIDGRQFLDMPLIAGTDLSDLLKRSGALAAPRAVAIVRQIASALDAAHAIGVVHGDVKPANILITPADCAYAVDFGIANAAPAKGVARVIGSAVSTWKYTAPERFTASSVNNKLDIYALACVLHQCLTGAPPYRADSVAALISAHLSAPVPQPSRLGPAIPTAFDEVISRGMAKDPVERYGTAGELALAAYEALSAPDQEQATEILQSSRESLGIAAEFTPPVASAAPARRAVPASQQSTQRRDSDAKVSQSSPGPSPSAGSTAAVGTFPRFGLGNTGWPGESGAPARRHRPPWVIPRRRSGWLAPGAAAVAVLSVIGGVAIWLLRPSAPAPTGPDARSATSSASSPSTVESQARLARLLPPGYSPGTCKPVTTSKDALAQLSCGQNLDPGGPLSATYTLFPDSSSVGSAFGRIIQASTIIECPGRIQSPGPWHRNATPDKASGVVLCGTQRGIPLLGWTDDADRLVGVINGQLPEPTIDQLYTWWTSHS